MNLGIAQLVSTISGCTLGRHQYTRRTRHTNNANSNQRRANDLQVNIKGRSPPRTLAQRQRQLKVQMTRSNILMSQKRPERLNAMRSLTMQLVQSRRGQVLKVTLDINLTRGVNRSHRHITHVCNANQIIKQISGSNYHLINSHLRRIIRTRLRHIFVDEHLGAHATNLLGPGTVLQGMQNSGGGLITQIHGNIRHTNRQDHDARHRGSILALVIHSGTTIRQFNSNYSALQ